MALVLPYRPQGAQTRLYSASKRYLVAPVGRQFGKSTIGQLRDMRFTWGNPEANHYTIYPVQSQARVQFRRLLRKYQGFYDPKGVNLTELSVRLRTGGLIRYFGSGDYENIKGDTLTSARIDECGKVHPDVWFEVVRPMLAVNKGRCDFMGTPKGMNWFAQMASLAQSGAPDYDYFHAPSNLSPFFPESEFQQARDTTPQMVFEQEYLALFLETGSQVFRGYKDCIGGDLQPPEPGSWYVMGVDLAKYSDFTVLTVWDVERKRLVAFERFNQLEWSFQEKKIIAMAERYNNAQTVVDATGVGDPIYERLRNAGLHVQPVKFSNAVKNRLIEDMAMMLEKREVSFPAIPELLHELTVFGVDTTKGGTIRYGAPGGYHDDIVISMALAMSKLKESRRIVDVRMS